MTLPLQGIRVFDASAGIAGPYAGHLLALAGADVIKVEPPQGEWGRIIGRKVGSDGLTFLAFNSGKRSFAVDLKSAEGAALAREIALQCDVVIENFRPGVMDRLGLGHGDLRAERPDLIYLSITGFGSSGPKAGRPALDTIIQAQSGWMDLVRDAAGAPILMEYPPVDVLTGAYAAQAAMAALIRRFRFGEGRRVEVSLLETATAFLAPKLMEAAILPRATGPSAGVPTGIYPTANGMIALAIKDDREFRQLCATLGHSEWAGEPRFATRSSRSKFREECEALIMASLATRTAAEWDDLFGRDGIVGAKINDLLDAINEPQMRALGRIRWEEHTKLGRIPRVPVPGLDDSAPTQAPEIGEHSLEILQQFGITPARIARAVTTGSVVTARVQQ